MKSILYADQILDGKNPRTRPGKITVDSTLGAIEAIEFFHTKSELQLEYLKDRDFHENRNKDVALSYLKNTLLTPSFINAHTHCAMSFFRHHLWSDPKFTKKNMIHDLFFHLEKHLDEEDVANFTTMGAYENLMQGVGLVWDHYYHPKGLVEGFGKTPLCAVIAPTLQDLFGPGKNDATKFMHEIVEFRNEGKNLFFALGPHATNTVSTSLWNKIAQVSVENNLPIHFHLSQTYDEYIYSLKHHGMPPLTYLYNQTQMGEVKNLLGVHGTYLTLKELDEMAQKENMTLVQCPTSASIFSFPADSIEWMKRGIPMVLGTDCVASNDSMNIHKEMRTYRGLQISPITGSKEYRNFLEDGSLAKKLESKKRQYWSRVAKHLEPHQLLDKIWKIPGELHPKFKAGLLAKGYVANINLWDITHPNLWPHPDIKTFCFADPINALKNMMILGKFILKNEKNTNMNNLLKTSSYLLAWENANKSLKKLIKKVSIT